VAALAALAVGCGSAPSPAAVTFVDQRREAAAAAKSAVLEAEAKLAALGAAPTAAQLTALRLAAGFAREKVNEARTGLPTFQTAEEELPIAESEAGVGANELNYAMAELARYATRPSAATLALYRTHLRNGRLQWNEAVRELWRLARAPNPPTV
jgi:hypothetical protein